MSVLQKQPSDVYINEYDLSGTIVSASSSVACQVIVSNMGSTKPLRFTNPNDYSNQYGKPNAQISFDVYCANDYFTEGNQLWGVRVVGSGALTSGVLLYNDSGVSTLESVSAGISDVDNIDFDTLAPSPKIPIAMFYPAKGPGSYANTLKISIETNDIATPSNVAVTSNATGGTLVAGTYQYQVTAINSTGETVGSTIAELVIASGGTSTNSATITWDNVPNATGYNLYGRASTGYGFMVQIGQGTLTFTDNGSLTVDDTIVPPTSATTTTDPSFLVNVYDTTISSSTPQESFNCTLTSGTDGDGVATELEEKINPFSTYIQVVNNTPALSSTPTVTSVTATAMAGGDSGTAPTSYDIANAWSTFSNKQLYSINTLVNSGHSDPNVQLAMDTLVQKRGDSVSLIDVPSDSQQYQQAVNYRNLSLNLNSSYSALFCPDVQESDNINGKKVFVPFSGWAAALCARTDRVANPSFSIAGLNRGLINVLQTRYSYDDGEDAALFAAQVNYTRTFIGAGIALWEQQTLQAKSSALSWLSVRRISNVIKVALYNFGLYVLQEPNDDFLRRQLVGSFNSYLSVIQTARGLTGYTVICDSSNNPTSFAVSGILRASVILIPTIPVNQLIIDVAITNQGVSFTETEQQLYGSNGSTSSS